MKRLKSILVVAALAFGSFSAVAQTTEEILKKSEEMSDEAWRIVNRAIHYNDELKIYLIGDEIQLKKGELLYQDSFKLYEKAIKQGSSIAEKSLLLAKRNLSYKYFDIKDCFKYKPLITELSVQNVDIELKAKALFRLAVNFKYGKCSRQDKEKALELLGQSCDLGDSFGCHSYNNNKNR